MTPHCARCGVPIEQHLVDPLACVDDQPHDFGDWKMAALPLTRFREFPGTGAGIVGIVALIPTYDRPMPPMGDIGSPTHRNHRLFATDLPTERENM
jgi:hypothetical protein